MSKKKKIAIIGVGKIAIDQHLPVIDKSTEFEVAATVSTRGVAHRDLPVFKTAAEFYRAMPDVGLVAICTPPGVRHAYVREAIDAGRHVLLEKPPTPTLTEFDDLVAYGIKKKRVLFHGEVTETALRGFYKACDIFVAPSRFESFGLIFVEAMMFGKATIGCDVGGIPEVVAHEESLLRRGDERRYFVPRMKSIRSWITFC